ncbi:MAG: hypothetical protein MJ051_04625 [Akkermansia sp.]|nr:hypothetical protein [Akkermansia sp.]
MLLFYCLLFGPYIIGTLAAGKTQSTVKMMVRGVFALLPLTLFLVFATLFVGGDGQTVLSSLSMWVGALVLHVAVSAMSRRVLSAEKRRDDK